MNFNLQQTITKCINIYNHFDSGKFLLSFSESVVEKGRQTTALLINHEQNIVTVS